MTGGPIVWIAGVGWDDVIGTDRRMVTAIAENREVIWVDSPHRGQWRGWWRRQGPAVEAVGSGITRLRAPAPPGFSRWPIRHLTGALQQWTIRRNLRRVVADAVVVASPVARFPRIRGAARVLFVTDDWATGAELMGLRRAWIATALSANARAADAIAMVSPPLGETLPASETLGEKPVAVIPNGAPRVDRIPGRREAVAGLVGQLNERLDLGILEALAEAGVPLRLVGPSTASDPEFRKRLTALVARENVEWTGALDKDALTDQLSRISVGITPYADTAFNRASFPLKTLEYLAAGVPVVSTDLAASRWLASPDVEIALSADDFVARVERLLSAKDDTGEEERVAFAATHGWPQRARALADLIDAAKRGRRDH